MVTCALTLASMLFLAHVSGLTDSGQQADEDEFALLQVRTVFVPRVWQDPDTPLDPGLGLNENTPPPQEQEAHFPTLPELPGWSRPDVPDPFEWPSPAQCEGSSFALLNISNGQADGIFWRCAGGQTLVPLGGSCIPVEKRCDGVKHCEDGSDELHCNETSQAAPGPQLQLDEGPAAGKSIPGLQPAIGRHHGLSDSSAAVVGNPVSAVNGGAMTGNVSVAGNSSGTRIWMQQQIKHLDGISDSIAKGTAGPGNSTWQMTKAQQPVVPSSGGSEDDSLWSLPDAAEQGVAIAAAAPRVVAATGAAGVPGLPGWPAEGARSINSAKENQKLVTQTGLAGLGIVLAQDEVALLQAHAVFIPGVWQDPAKPLVPGLGPSPRLETKVPPSSPRVAKLTTWTQPPAPEPQSVLGNQNFESLSMNPAAILAVPKDWTHPVDCVGASQYLTNGEGDDNFWRCIVGGHCIYVTNRCDGIKHCTDGSDELFCNTKLLKRVHDLEAANTELQDEVNYLRTGNTERLADYNTLRASLSALNGSLQSELSVFRSRSSSIAPHTTLQVELENLKAESTALQNEMRAIRTKSSELQSGANSQLVENVTSLRAENFDVLSSIAALKEDYVRLQLDLHPS